MKNQELVTSLKGFGLNENEAQVYLSSLALGPSSVQEIAKNAQLKRTTVYSLIESLKEKGLMTTQIQGLKKLIAAENPDRLGAIIEQRKERLKTMLPELNAIHNLKAGESFIKYYEGTKGVRAVYDTILNDLKPGDEYLIMSDMDRFLKMDESYFASFIEKRAKFDLKIRTLLQDNEAGHRYKKIEKNTHQQIKLLPKSINLTANLVVLPTKVVITQLVPPIMCILIENKSIVQMQHEQFDIIWKSLS